MKKSALFIAVLTTILPGCASITNSKLQPVSVNTVYEGDLIENAKCTLLNNKGNWYVTTPGSVTIQKSYGDMTVTCKKKGLPTGTMAVASRSNGGAWGNVLAGGIIGYAVDASSGAGFDYPTNINVIMGQSLALPQEPEKTEAVKPKGGR